MKLNIQDLLNNNDFIGFLELFDNEFSLSGNVYELGLSCSSYTHYKDLLQAWNNTFSDGSAYLIPSPDPQEFPLVDLLWVFPQGQIKSGIKSSFINALYIALKIDPLAIVTLQGFQAYKMPFFNSTTNCIKSLLKLQHFLRNTDLVGDLGHPNSLVKEKVHSMYSYGSNLDDIPIAENYILESDLSLNTIEIISSVDKKFDLVMEAEKISKSLNIPWETTKLNELYKFIRINELNEAQEIILLMMLGSQDSNLLPSPQVKTYLKEISPSLFNQFQLNSTCIKLSASSNHKLHLSLLDSFFERKKYNIFSKITSIRFSFLRK